MGCCWATATAFVLSSHSGTEAWMGIRSNKGFPPWDGCILHIKPHVGGGGRGVCVYVFPASIHPVRRDLGSLGFANFTFPHYTTLYNIGLNGWCSV